MLPKKYKFKKVQKGRISFTHPLRGTTLEYGSYGIKSLQSGILESKHLIALKKSLLKYVKKKGRLWIRVFPHISRTKKPEKIRMGKGKGNVSHWICRIKQNHIILEISTTDSKRIIHFLQIAKHKLPLKTIIVYKK